MRPTPLRPLWGEASGASFLRRWSPASLATLVTTAVTGTASTVPAKPNRAPPQTMAKSTTGRAVLREGRVPMSLGLGATAGTVGAGIGGVIGYIVFGARDGAAGILVFEAVVAAFLVFVTRTAARAPRA